MTAIRCAGHAHAVPEGIAAACVRRTGDRPIREAKLTCAVETGSLTTLTGGLALPANRNVTIGADTASALTIATISRQFAYCTETQAFGTSARDALTVAAIGGSGAHLVEIPAATRSRQTGSSAALGGGNASHADRTAIHTQAAGTDSITTVGVILTGNGINALCFGRSPGTQPNHNCRHSAEYAAAGGTGSHGTTEFVKTESIHRYLPGWPDSGLDGRQITSEEAQSITFAGVS